MQEMKWNVWEEKKLKLLLTINGIGKREYKNFPIFTWEFMILK